MSPTQREGGRIQQRWGEEAAQGRAAGGWNKAGKVASSSLAVCNTKRLLLEFFVFAVLLLWVFMMAHNLASRFKPCFHEGMPVGRAAGNRFVIIKSWTGATHWNAGVDGVLSAWRAGQASNSSFHVEWQDKEWFCLRSLADLRLVEVAPADDPKKGVLRTGRFGCSQPAQLFSYRGHSIFSKGAGSYVNMREQQNLRAHGDTLPWSPLLRETRQTRVAVDNAPEAKDPEGFERRLLGLLPRIPP